LLKLTNKNKKKLSSYEKMLDPCRTKQSNLEIKIVVNGVQSPFKDAIPSWASEEFYSLT